MQDREPEDFREGHAIKHIWRSFQQNRVALISLYAFLLLVFTALFSPFIAPYPSDMQFSGYELMPPSWVDEGKIAYFLGTDDLGRDILSRIISGASYTLGATMIVVIFVALLGGILGIWIGMSHSLKSQMLNHFLNTFLSIPSLLIAIIIATLMKPSLLNAMLATTLALLPYFIHEIYQAIQQELKKEYVLMLKIEGASNWFLLKESILPNISVQYIEEVARAFAIVMLDITALSFISLGAQRPSPEWGAMIKDSLELIYLAPWAVLLPGIAIILSILTLSLFSQGLCKAIRQYYD